MIIFWIVFSMLTFYLVTYNFLYDFNDELNSFMTFYKMFNPHSKIDEKELIEATKIMKWGMSLSLGTCYGILGPIGLLMIVLIKFDSLRISDNTVINIGKWKKVTN